jgi:hypothetical protein
MDGKVGSKRFTLILMYLNWHQTYLYTMYIMCMYIYTYTYINRYIYIYTHIYIYTTLYNICYPIFRKIPDFAASTPHHRQHRHLNSGSFANVFRSSRAARQPWSHIEIACRLMFTSPFIWQCVKTLYPCSSHQNSWDLWMFIPLKMVKK